MLNWKNNFLSFIIRYVNTIYKCFDFNPRFINFVRNFAKIKFSICFISLKYEYCCKVSLWIMNAFKRSIFFSCTRSRISWSKNVSPRLLSIWLITFIIIIRRYYYICMISYSKLHFVCWFSKSHFTSWCKCKCFRNT
jgi:hypothetical protein